LAEGEPVLLWQLKDHKVVGKRLREMPRTEISLWIEHDEQRPVDCYFATVQYLDADYQAGLIKALNRDIALI